MSKLDVVDMKGMPVGQVDLGDACVAVKNGQQAVYDVIVAYQAGLRSGTASTLTKGEVAGSGKKPWKQKGTGRARAGYRRSPVWRGGGVAFGPKVRSYAQRIPRKVSQLAFRRAFSEKVAAGEIRILQDLQVDSPKTKGISDLFKQLKIEGTVLIVVAQLADNAVKAARNLPGVELVLASTVNTYQLVRYSTVILTRAAFDVVQGRLEGHNGEAQ
jgi:large subunit ribosomal protein L4